MEKIILDELFDNNYDCYTEFDLNKSHSDEAPAMTKEKFKEVMIEYSKQLLELAAENAKIEWFHRGKLHHISDAFYPDEDSDYYINQESITDIIKQVD